MTNTIGQSIKKLRKERNLTQEELAAQLNVSAQAVSKWENETGLPDISQVIPLASVFGVSTDALFGLEDTNVDEEALKIVQKADAMRKHGKLDTLLIAYDAMLEGLKRYPCNRILLLNCMHLGLNLSLPENGWMYAPERAKEIRNETIRQANLIIAHSKNISDIFTAQQALVFLYSSEKRYQEAISEAGKFPVRPDFTLYSNMARVNESMGNHPQEIMCLCSEIDYSLQGLEDAIARLGKAYYNSGKYKDAISTYETFFDIMKAIFKDSCPPPYHDFDSGDCHILLAQAYLAIGETDRAMDSVEDAVNYALDLMERCTDGKTPWKTFMQSPLVQETETTPYITKSMLKASLLEKITSEEIQALQDNQRFQALCEKVRGL